MPLVDLDDPEELRARWSALAAVAHATGFDRRWYADADGWYHQDETGSDLRMVRLDGGRSVLFGYHTQHSQTRGTDLLAGAPDWIGQPEVKRRITAGDLGFVYGSFNGTWARASYEGDPWQPVDDGFGPIGAWITSDEETARELVEWAAEWADYLGGLDELVPLGVGLIRSAAASSLSAEELDGFFARLGIGRRSPQQPDLRAALAAVGQFDQVAGVAVAEPAPVVEEPEDEEELFIVPPGVSPFTGQPIAEDAQEVIGAEPSYDAQPYDAQPSYEGQPSYETPPPSEPADTYGVVSKKPRLFGRKKKQPREEDNASLAGLGLAAPDPEPAPPRTYDRPLPSSEPPRVGAPVQDGEDFYASLFADAPSAASYTPDTPTDQQPAEPPWSANDATSEFASVGEDPAENEAPYNPAEDTAPYTPVIDDTAPFTPFPDADPRRSDSPFAPSSRAPQSGPDAQPPAPGSPFAPHAPGQEPQSPFAPSPDASPFALQPPASAADAIADTNQAYSTADDDTGVITPIDANTPSATDDDTGITPPIAEAITPTDSTPDDDTGVIQPVATPDSAQSSHAPYPPDAHHDQHPPADEPQDHQPHSPLDASQGQTASLHAYQDPREYSRTDTPQSQPPDPTSDAARDHHPGSPLDAARDQHPGSDAAQDQRSDSSVGALQDRQAPSLDVRDRRPTAPHDAGQSYGPPPPLDAVQNPGPTPPLDAAGFDQPGSPLDRDQYRRPGSSVQAAQDPHPSSPSDPRQDRHPASPEDAPQDQHPTSHPNDVQVDRPPSPLEAQPSRAVSPLDAHTPDHPQAEPEPPSPMEREWVGGAWINGEWIEDAAAYLAANPHLAHPPRPARRQRRTPSVDPTTADGLQTPANPYAEPRPDTYPTDSRPDTYAADSRREAHAAEPRAAETHPDAYAAESRSAESRADIYAGDTRADDGRPDSRDADPVDEPQGTADLPTEAIEALPALDEPQDTDDRRSDDVSGDDDEPGAADRPAPDAAGIGDARSAGAAAVAGAWGSAPVGDGDHRASDVPGGVEQPGAADRHTADESGPYPREDSDHQADVHAGGDEPGAADLQAAEASGSDPRGDGDRRVAELPTESFDALPAADSGDGRAAGTRGADGDGLDARDDEDRRAVDVRGGVGGPSADDRHTTDVPAAAEAQPANGRWATDEPTTEPSGDDAVGVEAVDEGDTAEDVDGVWADDAVGEQRADGVGFEDEAPTAEIAAVVDEEIARVDSGESAAAGEGPRTYPPLSDQYGGSGGELENYEYANEVFHDEILGSADWTADQLGEISIGEARPEVEAEAAGTSESRDAELQVREVDEPEQQPAEVDAETEIAQQEPAEQAPGAEQTTAEQAQAADQVSAVEVVAVGIDESADAAGAEDVPASEDAPGSEVVEAVAAVDAPGEAAGSENASESVAIEEPAEADEQDQTADHVEEQHEAAEHAAAAGAAQLVGEATAAQANGLNGHHQEHPSTHTETPNTPTTDDASAGMLIPELSSPGVPIALPLGVEQAMRAEPERPRPRPKESAAFEALRAWCRVRTNVVPSGFTLQVQVLDPARPSYRFDLEPAQIDDEEWPDDRLSELLGDLWIEEARTDHGGWLFARIDAAGRTLRIDRWYDQVPEWWDTQLPGAIDVEGLVRRLYRRGPDWQPSYLEQLYITAG